VQSALGGPTGYLAGLFGPRTARRTAVLFRQEAETCQSPEMCLTFIAVLGIARGVLGENDPEDETP
jgi:hypothetical protein